MPNRVITNQDQALDSELQVSSASGTNDTKFTTPLKLFNWRAWFMSLINIFTNTTDSTSTSSGAVVINGGLGVMKKLFTKALAVTDLAGSGSRLMSADATGLISAPFIITAPTVTDSTIQNTLGTENNWNDAGLYTGTAISNGIQSQFYKAPGATPWLYLMYDSTTAVRIPIGGGLNHLRGVGGTPAFAVGTAAGTGATVSNGTGNDIASFFTLNTGSNPANNAVAVATITFAKAYSVAVKSIIIQPGTGAPGVVFFPSGIGTTSFNISVMGQLPANTSIIIYILIAA